MSEVLTFNTETEVIQSERIDPLPVYTDEYYMLNQKMPICVDTLPNKLMNILVQRLKMTMKLYAGLGLSANQCGVQQRIFVMHYNGNVITCINPEVSQVSDEIVRAKEGCLSFPGMYLTIPRNQWIIAEFTDENGNRLQARMEGIEARCFLHELDHMNGIKFTDHVGPVAIKLARDKQAKLIKKTLRNKKGK